MKTNAIPSPSVGHTRIAIAEVTIFSLVQLVHFITRFMQEWQYWHHRRERNVRRCVLYSWFGMLGILAQLRIAGSAMVIAVSNPSKPVWTAEIILQSIGLSPLLFEVSLVLLRSGQAGRSGPGSTRYPEPLRFLLHGFRFPVILSLVCAVVGETMDISACRDIGSAVFVITFAFVIGLVLWIAIVYRTVLPRNGHRGVMLVLATLPFLAVRIAYFLLSEYGSDEFNAVTGKEGIKVGMGLLMEIIATVLLLLSRGTMEPFGYKTLHAEEYERGDRP
ncbi:hypothetical protein CNMCM6805_009628 [Aspergillus fumigatiaffinis]|uniref:DUF7702 domain-containing protein n=1 Tax=Aspergillus fumigatiaffinis TaxID=340414 RepID=A0A8H4LYU6_9EURO|nr:hypothetical protein CNMCM5878_001058 [Aspergillus fumigatiaffinis]KAF4223014.1 hypothetical protein CNMCM6457_000935 [Aspergillus fumigatiaffinis]KAF4232820.1 hypothetical protein CNMCM6805_009628 [Aspergillus fumigatiaffinis]